MSTMDERNNRILIVDDNPAIHDDFRKILSSPEDPFPSLTAAEALMMGEAPARTQPVSFEIDSAFQGAEALEVVRRGRLCDKRYAVAFVDLRMPPGLDGVETIARLWREDPDLQMVICTAYSDYSWEEITTQLGQSDNLLVLKKPFDNIEVLQLAHALARKWSLAQQARLKLEDLDEMVRAQTQELRRANEQLETEVLERKQAQEALRISEERFSRAFLASPFPMAIQSLPDWRYLDVNDRFLEMTGYSREEIIGRTSEEAPVWATAEARLKALQSVQRGLTVRDFECQIRTKSGERRDGMVSLELIDLDHRPHLLIITQDTTERGRLENQLRQAQKMEAVGKLSAGIAHDFNNILTIIQGYTGLALSADQSGLEIRSTLTQVLTASERAATLIRQLLAFSRKQIMQPKVVDLNQVIQHFVNMLGRLIGENIRLEVNYAAGLPPIWADTVNLEQVIMNLVVNARDAMPVSGRLIISTGMVEIDERNVQQHPEASVGRFVWFSVTDTGCGIDPSILEHLFEPFFTTKDVGEGTGMGLAMVYGTVKQHQGWIEVATRKDQGATFKVFLPATQTPAAELQTCDIPPTPARGGHETILVVEDEHHILALICRVLRDRGYAILTAPNSTEAIEVWKRHAGKIDLLLTDIVMPGGVSGRTLGEQLSAEKPGLKVIYTSGYSLEALGAGSNLKEGLNFLPKPYQPKRLIETVRTALDAVRETD